MPVCSEYRTVCGLPFAARHSRCGRYRHLPVGSHRQFSGRELAKMLAVIGAINGVAPVAAPIAGGLLTDVIGWHGIFWILLGLGVILLAGSYRFRESLPSEQRSAEKWKDTFRSFGTVLHDKRYVCYVLQMAFAQGVLFANIASSPLSSNSITASPHSLSASVSRSTPCQSVSQPPCRSNSTARKAVPWPDVAA